MKVLLTRVVALAVALALLVPRPACAWHKEGHMAVALIGFRQLDEAQQARVHDILKKHPHYDLFLAADAPADATLDEWVVMRAAIWPDWVKSPSSVPDKKTRSEITNRFGHGDWHYVNKPIVHLADANPEEKAQVQENLDNPKKKRGEIMKRLPELIAGVKGDANVDLVKLVWAPKSVAPTIDADGAKAIALCWILHLVGDIHQPLHAAALFTKDSLDGDHGGNDFVVRWGNRAANLHAIWDGEFGWDDLKAPGVSQYEAVDVLARDLVARVKPSDAAKAELRLEKWRDESWELAKTKAYFVNGKLLPGVFVSFSEHKPHGADLDPLPPGYSNAVRKTAEQRVTLAGYRLGKLLPELAPAP